MTCQTCIHRLDVTLWGCWLATGCRVELAALRQLAKVCAKVRGNQQRVTDADVIAVPVLITHDEPFSQTGQHAHL